VLVISHGIASRPTACLATASPRSSRRWQAVSRVAAPRASSSASPS